MKKLLITTAALSFALVGCQTTYTEPPKLEHNKSDVYVWDDSKSTALNWANIGVQPHGIMDAEKAEDAQDIISEAEQNAWTLLSFASGGIAQGFGMSAFFGVIDEAQHWNPTFIFLVEPKELNAESALTEISKQLAPALEKSGYYKYEGISYSTHSRGSSNAYILASGDSCQYSLDSKKAEEWVLDAPEDFNGCIMASKVQILNRIQLPSGKLYDVVILELYQYSRWALTFANHFDGPVVFPVNYRINLDGKDCKRNCNHTYSAIV
ncbi:hypothetical protein [Idiomarina aminovorans]|uniref:hypothetical protein n=1 Tax=Idiomarina aminovorans TaxID=2914829 RepID=UPI0020058DE2|nr:hypothetical protein [Idiomarina sp. ATCH4]MCK7458779.1 hypothetical protein [Idiomarina sp. ATCH4]